MEIFDQSVSEFAFAKAARRADAIASIDGPRQVTLGHVFGSVRRVANAFLRVIPGPLA
jgi:hypothetical protein